MIGYFLSLLGCVHNHSVPVRLRFSGNRMTVNAALVTPCIWMLSWLTLAVQSAHLRIWVLNITAWFSVCGKLSFGNCVFCPQWPFPPLHRALYCWLTAKDLNRLDFDPYAPPESLLGMLRAVKYGEISYNDLFKRLCQWVGSTPCWGICTLNESFSHHVASDDHRLHAHPSASHSDFYVQFSLSLSLSD